LLLPHQDRITFAFTPLAHGDLGSIGKASLTTLHTSGHTNKSMCFLLNDSALFSGGFIASLLGCMGPTSRGWMDRS